MRNCVSALLPPLSGSLHLPPTMRPGGPQVHPRRLVRVRAARARRDLVAAIEFDDRACRDVDLGPYLRGPMFEAIRRDRRVFAEVRVEGGTITWPNGTDIDPDVLYYELAPAWMANEEVTQVRGADALPGRMDEQARIAR